MMRSRILRDLKIHTGEGDDGRFVAWFHQESIATPYLWRSS